MASKNPTSISYDSLKGTAEVVSAGHSDRKEDDASDKLVIIRSNSTSDDHGQQQDTTTNTTSTETKKKNILLLDDCLYHRQGTFFATAILVLSINGFLVAFNHLVVYIGTAGWFRIASALALGLVDDSTLETAGHTSHHVINWHAFLGIAVTLLVALQVTTGNLIHHNVRRAGAAASIEKMVHGKVGRIVIVLWTVTTIFGLIFTVVSKRLHRSDEDNHGKWWSHSMLFVAASFWSLALATVVNMSLGVRAALLQKKKATGDSDDDDDHAQRLLEHKGLMFFAIYWILGSALDECLMTIVQLIVQDCYIDYFGTVLCAAFGQTIQVTAIVLGAFLFERTILKHNFFRINAALLVARTLFLCGFAIYLAVSHNKASINEEHSCWKLDEDVYTGR